MKTKKEITVRAFFGSLRASCLGVGPDGVQLQLLFSHGVLEHGAAADRHLLEQLALRASKSSCSLRCSRVFQWRRGWFTLCARVRIGPRSGKGCLGPRASRCFRCFQSAKVLDNFGSVGRTTLSLYMAVTGGDDWANYYNALEALGGIYHYLFLAP